MNSKCFCFGLIVACVSGANMFGNGGFGGPSEIPISTTEPKLPGGIYVPVTPPYAAPGRFLRDFKPPYPTNSWWQGLAVGVQENPIAGPFPFHVRTRNQAIEFGIAEKRTLDLPKGESRITVLKQPVNFDMSMSFLGIPDSRENRKATGWDTQTVSLQYFSGISTMDTTLVPGSPYMTFHFVNAQVKITSYQGNIGFTWVTKGFKAKINMYNGPIPVTYILYVVNGMIEFTVASNTLTATMPFTGTLRLAKVINQQETVLDEYALTYATGMSMKYAVSGDTSTQTWTWNVVGTPGKLLLMTWSHHRKVLPATTKYVNLEYMTIKGPMKAVAGNVWIQKHRLPTTLWTGKLAPHPSCVNELTKTLEYEVSALQEENEPDNLYFWGGNFAKNAQMAIFAEHIGRKDLIPKIISYLKSSISYWLKPGKYPLSYDKGWGAMILGNDVLNVQMNDHHFNYGYFLHGAAIIGKYDPDWLKANLDFLNNVARNIGNPSPNDPYYPVSRNFDFFHGHSWASGVGGDAGRRNEESSTEAINAYYGLILFGKVSQNTGLVNFGRMLLAMEMVATQLYWHLYPQASPSETPYPEQEARDLVTVGNLLDTEIGTWLHWTDVVEYGPRPWRRYKVAAIQILPLTPMSFSAYDVEWMKNVVPYCEAELDNPAFGTEFKSVLYAAYAAVNPKLAYEYSRSVTEWGSGNSASGQLYFISTQSTSGLICDGSHLGVEGIFYIQDVKTGKYILTSFQTNPDIEKVLNAKTTSTILATKFRLAYIPGGTTIQDSRTTQYVNAGDSGTSAMVANRVFPRGYERFRWNKLDDGSYELKALSNKKLVETRPNGNLLNTGTGSTYRLVLTETDAKLTLPAQGKLKNIKSGQYIVSTIAKPELALSQDKALAAVFRFEKVAGNEADSVYALRNIANGKVMRADPKDSNVPMAADRDVAKYWEQFRILQPQEKGGSYVIVHLANGLAVATQSDGKIRNNDANVGDESLWVIES